MAGQSGRMLPLPPALASVTVWYLSGLRLLGSDRRTLVVVSTRYVYQVNVIILFHLLFTDCSEFVVRIKFIECYQAVNDSGKLGCYFSIGISVLVIMLVITSSLFDLSCFQAHSGLI